MTNMYKMQILLVIEELYMQYQYVLQFCCLFDVGVYLDIPQLQRLSQWYI